MFLQGGDGDHQIVAFGPRGKADGAVGDRLMECLGAEIARAFVEHGARESRKPCLAGRVIG